MSPGTRIAGIVLFLPVPVVLFLFTRMPFGVVPSLAAGLAIMITHPLYARPWALRHAPHRCLWCGGSVAAGPGDSAPTTLAVTDPRGTVSWRACNNEHHASLVSTLRFATRYGTLLRVGVFGTVTIALAVAVLADRGWLGPLRVSDASAFFRLGVGLTVLPLGWLGPRLCEQSGAHSGPIGLERSGTGGTEPPFHLRAPFPLHLAALIGANEVLWLFRLVGLIWVAQGAFYLVEQVSRD